MLAFIARRLVVSFFVLLAATFVMYLLVAFAGDPLEELYFDTSPNRDAKIEARTEALNLDTPVLLRYLGWLGGVSGCVIPGAECDWGLTATGQQVSTLIGGAIGQTLQLVIAATVIALVLGVMGGVVTALRQYSSLDYSATFAAFLFFSLPIFWVAVLLKQYVAIDFNNWLADPVVSTPVTIILGLISGGVWMMIIGGDRQRKQATFGIAAVASAAVVWVISATRWFEDPSLGPVLVALMAIGSALLMTALLAGFRYKRVMYATLATAGVGIVVNLFLDSIVSDPSWAIIALLLLITIVVSGGIGAAAGALLRRQAVTASIFTGVLTAGIIYVDRLLAAWAGYASSVGGRPIATFGARTPGFDGGYWQNTLDTATHLLLPTIAIALISFATYTRFTRASMLEVKSQDYVRTARAKGLSERVVNTRHAFRNALIPVTTLMAFDFGAVISGAVITENVFGWQGMGKMFIDRLFLPDPNPVMAFFVITGGAVVVFNMLADIAYAYLDPRIRL
ncbi:MAG TPA: ABC transporter permease [Jiangellaceae bacterium]